MIPVLLRYGGYIPLINRIITLIIKYVKGVMRMIVFDRLWVTMKEKGFSTYKLREQCGIDSKTIRRLKANENIETKTIDKICAALNCRIEDIAQYVENTDSDK
ncbi:MAG: helix-turn-helix transcriptional regulator [Ruminococcaceae bacterium]|nr:helix-turn-helix transcriptional regulator [Oscillospiraceae bacterium]